MNRDQRTFDYSPARPARRAAASQVRVVPSPGRTRQAPGLARRAFGFIRREFFGTERFIIAIGQGIAVGGLIVLGTMAINKWLSMIEPVTGLLR